MAQELRHRQHRLTTHEGPRAAGGAVAQHPGSTTYAGQLAERVAELLPDLNADECLKLLGVMNPDDSPTSSA